MAATMDFLTTTETQLPDFWWRDLVLTDLCEQTRAEAFSITIDHAKALGANA